MSHIFISHVEEDTHIALDLALRLERQGFRTCDNVMRRVVGKANRPGLILLTGWGCRVD
jgi:hypothetical protein